jgi:adenylate cyclase
MTETLNAETGNEDLWRTVFADGHPHLKKQHRLHRMLPSPPRCRMCLVPFGGLGGWIMRKTGKGRSKRNPHFCGSCDGFLESYPGGAEVEMPILYADIRNSTAFADTQTPAAVSARISRFLHLVTSRIAENDGFVMAFYGDCVVAVWPPGFSGSDGCAKALKAARGIVRDIGLAGDDETAIPVGVGLHRGPAYICTVEANKGTFRDISIFGLSVIIAARLASRATAHQVLVSAAAMADAEFSGDWQTLDLKGVSDPVRAAELG